MLPAVGSFAEWVYWLESGEGQPKSYEPRSAERQLLATWGVSGAAEAWYTGQLRNGIRVDSSEVFSQAVEARHRRQSGSVSGAAEKAGNRLTQELVSISDWFGGFTMQFEHLRHEPMRLTRSHAGDALDAPAGRDFTGSLNEGELSCWHALAKDA